MTSVPGKSPLAIVIALAVIAGGCGSGGVEAGKGKPDSGGNEAASTDKAGEPSPRKNEENGAAKARAEGRSKPGAGKPGAKVGNAAGKGDREAKRRGGGEQPRRVALNLRGDPGTAFSGVCVVGGERTDFAAKTPQRYEFRTRRPGLECRVVKRGADDSTLRAVLTARGERHAQRTDAARSAIAFSFSKRGFSSEVRSSSGFAGGESSSSIRMSSDQDSSVVTVHREGERDVAR